MPVRKFRAAVTLIAATGLASVAHGAESEQAKPPMVIEGIPADGAVLRDLVARLDQSMF